MYLVYKQDIVFFERGQNAGQVTGLVQHRAAGDLEAYAQFVGYDAGERSLAQSGRPEK